MKLPKKLEEILKTIKTKWEKEGYPFFINEKFVNVQNDSDYSKLKRDLFDKNLLKTKVTGYDKTTIDNYYNQHLYSMINRLVVLGYLKVDNLTDEKGNKKRPDNGFLPTTLTYKYFNPWYYRWSVWQWIIPLVISVMALAVTIIKD